MSKRSIRKLRHRPTTPETLTERHERNCAKVTRVLAPNVRKRIAAEWIFDESGFRRTR